MTPDKRSVSTKTSLINQQKGQTHFLGKILALLWPLVPLIIFYLFGLKIKNSISIKGEDKNTADAVVVEEGQKSLPEGE